MRRSPKLTLLLALALIDCRVAGSGADSIATVRELGGEVTYKKEKAGETTAAAVGLELAEGDVVSTGKDGRARLEFAGGNTIELSADTSLVIRKAGATATEIGAVLLTGSARAKSGGGGVVLSIGAPFGITRVGDGQSELELSAQGGITVLVGTVSVLLQNGEQRTIQAGNTLKIDGLIVPIGKSDAADGALRLEPITVVLLANPKQVQVMRRGDGDWDTPRKRDVLAVGDVLRTRKADGTLVQFGDVAGLELEAGTEMTLDAAGLDPKNHRAHYTLSSGTAKVTANRKDGLDIEHEVVAAGTLIKVRPGLERADVQIAANKDGRVKVDVQLGQALLPDGTVIEAGSSVAIDKSKTASEAKPLAGTEVELKPKSNSILYYLRDIPPVFFNWKTTGGETKDYQIEVAKDKEFSDVVFREKITKAGFVYEGFNAGRYWWRVNNGKDWDKGTFTIKKGGDNECKNCQRTNTIYDTGEKTVVYYQQALPSITLRWDAVAGAAHYRVKVFKDGDFDNPEVDDVVKETTAHFRPGKLQEGKYYWLTVAQDAADKELATSRTNSLEIAYDNAITDLLIKSPSDGAKVTGKTLVTQGEVQLGARLYIDTEPVKVDRSGRFRHTVTLGPGLNRIVFRTIASDGIERFYLREITRR